MTLRLHPVALVWTSLALASLACQTLAPGNRPTPTELPRATEVDPTEAPTAQPDPTDRPNPTGRDHGVAQPAADPNASQYLELSGQEQVYDTARFRVHYTLSGRDSIPATPANKQGTPTFVVELGDRLEGAWTLVVDDWGWVAPPPDSGWGGNNLYDVYIGRDEDDELGYVWTVDELPMGDNPNSPDIVERHAQASYMHLRRGFATGDGFSSAQELADYLDTTVVHEFMHSVQYGYDGGERPEWMWEAVAMWSESLAFPGESDDTAYIIDYVSAADDCLGRADPYSVWPFFRYLSDRHGMDLVRRIWEQARDLEGVNAVRTALRDDGLDLSTEWTGFAQAMLLRDFLDGADFHPLIPADTLSGPGTVQRNVGHLGLEAIDVTTSGPITLTLSGDPEVTARAVGIRDRQASVFDLSSGSVSLNADDFDSLVVMVTYASDQGGSNACTHVDYRLRLEPGGQPAEPTNVFDAPKFLSLH